MTLSTYFDAKRIVSGSAAKGGHDMATTDLRRAKQEAKRTARLAVRTFAREPSADHEQAVAQAWARVRMLDELQARRSRESLERAH